jgi:hypothetical protein
MKHSPLMERRAERPVQPILQIELAAPLNHVREQVPIEGGVLSQQRMQVEPGLGRDQLIEPDLPRRNLCPLTGPKTMLRVRASFTDRLENHPSSLSTPTTPRAPQTQTPNSNHKPQ